MVAASPKPQHHPSLMQASSHHSPVMPAHHLNPSPSKPTPPRSPSSSTGIGVIGVIDGGLGGSVGVGVAGRSSIAPQSPPITNSSPNQTSGGSYGGSAASYASRGSNNTRPSSSPEGRSVRTSGGSKGSVENQRDGAAASSMTGITNAMSSMGVGSTISEGEQQSLSKEPQQSPLATNAGMAGSSNGSGGALANKVTNGANGATVAPRVSLAVNTGRSLASTNNPLTIANNSSNSNSNSNNNNNHMGNAPVGNYANPNGTPPKTTPSLPKNPKDTAAYISPGGVALGGASPKRRMKTMGSTSLDFGDPFGGGVIGVGNFGGSGGGSVGVVGTAPGGVTNTTTGSVGGYGGATVKSARSVPMSYLQAAGTAGPIAPSSSPLLHPGSNTPGSVDSLHSMKDISAPGITVDTHSDSLPNLPHVRDRIQGRQRHSLDDEEQFMFEQRLTQDELGVAIRKISHSGKAQLRYVKCVPLRPPSSSDFDDADPNAAKPGPAGANVQQQRGLNVPYLDAHSGHALRPKPPSDSISVSSRSSAGSRFGRMMRNTRNTTSSISMRRLISNSNSTGGPGGASGEGRTPPSTAMAAGSTTGSEDNLLLHDADKLDKSLRALTWGKKNAVMLSLDKFTCVRKGKTTERTARNSSPSSRLLSIMTCARGNESLDIEAPTMLDRDKFASAFARFLGVPLVEEGAGGRATLGGVKKKIRTPSLTRSKKNKLSAAHSEPGPTPLSPSLTATPKVRNRCSTNDSLLPALTPTSDEANDADRQLSFDNFNSSAVGNSGEKQTIGNTSRKAGGNVVPTQASVVSPGMTNASSHVGSQAGDETLSKHTMETMSESARKRISLDGGRGESMLEPRTSAIPPPSQDHGTARGGSRTDHANQLTDNLDPTMDPHGPTIHARKDAHHSHHADSDNHSHVSSLTGGVDQEIVEELHQAIIELRSELDASRAEAARAVKVAEQAIQSAENCTSSDWNSTVTHKAAEAAAQAQKKSAEAIARARMAEERLASERRSTVFWRKQAQSSEEEAGSLKTRSAAAEVKQAIMMEELASERRKAARMFANLKSEFVRAEKRQGGELSMIQERKRGLEVELEEMQNEMKKKEKQMKLAMEAEIQRNEKPKGPNRMKPNFRRPRSSSRPNVKESGKSNPEAAPPHVAALQNEIITLRKQFDLVRHTSMDDITSLHRQSEEWSNQASRAVAASTAETELLREKLAAESAMRLKLLNELQDIRGTVRVYCRPKQCTPGKGKPIIKIPTHDILVLNEDTSPVSFKFDRVFSPGTSQYEVFSELEEPLISSLDGFNVTLMAFGQGGSGKTHTLLGDVNWDDAVDREGGNDDLPSLKSHGVQLQAVQQLFTIAGHRTDRYKDAFSITMVEVHNEKLHDLIAGTPSAERDGEVVLCETRDRSSRDKRRGGGEAAVAESAAGWRKGKLEIRTDVDGNTVVQGLVSVAVGSFQEALAAWREAIAQRAERLRSQGLDAKKYERKTNVITTVKIKSVNIATGVGTEGKLQFVDMASSDVVRGSKKAREDREGAVQAVAEEDDTQFGNKSIDAFNDVVNARIQFDRSVPYRNATLTHLLRDSLEADTKVLLMCCVSSEQAHVADTMGALRFASRMQKVSIGKATKHIGSKE